MTASQRPVSATIFQASGSRPVIGTCSFLDDGPVAEAGAELTGWVELFAPSVLTELRVWRIARLVRRIGRDLPLYSRGYASRHEVNDTSNRTGAGDPRHF